MIITRKRAKRLGIAVQAWAGYGLDPTEDFAVFTNPRDPYTRSLISAVPVVDDDELSLRNSLAEGT